MVSTAQVHCTIKSVKIQLCVGNILTSLAPLCVAQFYHYCGGWGCKSKDLHELQTIYASTVWPTSSTRLKQIEDEAKVSRSSVSKTVLELEVAVGGFASQSV